jgi:hypothetical protein
MQNYIKVIKDNILNEISNSPKLFSGVLIVLINVKPNTLRTALSRKSKYIKRNIEIGNYLLSLGYIEEEIFDNVK